MVDFFGDFNEADYKPDLASAIAAEVMGLKWTHTPAGETVEDEIAASGEHCNRYGDVQEAVCKVLEEARTKPHTVSISAAPSLDLGGGEEKGETHKGSGSREPGPSVPASGFDHSRTIALLNKRIDMAHQDADSHPEGHINRAFYRGQAIAYENTLSALLVDIHGVTE